MQFFHTVIEGPRSLIPDGAIMFKVGLCLAAEGQMKIDHHLGEAVRDQAWKCHPSFMPHSIGKQLVT